MNIPKSHYVSETLNFHYLKKDGKCFIGEDPWHFELEWEGFNNQEFLRLYDRPKNIISINLLPEGVEDIDQVKNDFNIHDDNRMTELTKKRVCLVLNDKGYYLAIKLKAIDPPNGTAVLEYKIATDRSANFSKSKKQS
ncbi:MAG: hypothetical protein HRT47_01550 [Candidatus Caenarcaniphilales bacterium]|nr:hypothetical protein [Candidatus Caenarcaniphilales bacterium]